MQAPVRKVWLTTAHKNLQRVGQIRLLAALAPAGRAEDPSALAKRYWKTLTRQVQTPDGVQEWQAWALAQLPLPSCTGIENASSVSRASQFAAELGIIRSDTLTRTPLGDLFARGVEAEDPSAFLTPPGVRYLTAATLDDRDRDVSAAALAELPAGEFHFNSVQLREIAISLLRSISGDQFREGNQRARALLDQMEGKRARSVSRETARRVFEDFWIPRLEFLTDLGILRKSRCDSYSYQVACQIQGGITDSLFPDTAPPEDCVEAIRTAYLALKNHLGFAPVRESLVLANMTRAGVGQPVMLLSVADGWLRQRTRGGAMSVRLVLDRDGRAGSFKIIGGTSD